MPRTRPRQTKNADARADYLQAQKDYLHFDRALTQGWPTVSVLIKGAVRHLLKDRLDLTSPGGDSEAQTLP